MQREKGLTEFVAALAGNDDLMAELKKMQDGGSKPADVVELAASRGYRLSEDQVAVLADRDQVKAMLAAAGSVSVLEAHASGLGSLPEKDVVRDILDRKAKFDSIIGKVGDADVWP